MRRKIVGDALDEKDFLIDNINSTKDHLKAIRNGVVSIPDLGKYLMRAEMELMHAAEAVRKSRSQDDDSGEQENDTTTETT